MKKIREDAFIKIFMIFVGVFFFFFIGFYILFENFLLELISQNHLNTQELLPSFNFLFLEFFLFALSILLFVFYMLKKINTKLEDDIQEIKNYVTEISSHKNYDAIIKIKNYTEFLEISLILKNIVKRLKQKEKKARKK